jgi:histidyl-tRNA synthetase
MISIPKGTKDMLPSEAHKWHFIEERARKTAKLFNIREIRTPTFEHTELFLRGVGDTTDIVGKEMYTFADKGGRSMTLKPEGTASVARAFIENGLINEPMPLKMYYFTSVFRYERPQAGRLREHHQFGIEYFGSKSPSADCEIIAVADTFFKKLGIDGLSLFINSIGCRACRPSYNEALKEYLWGNAQNLCPACRDRLERNPLRVLDCKEPGCSKLLEGAPKTTNHLCVECVEHFDRLREYLGAIGIEYCVNPRIVRGLDYYTKTVFEFTSSHLGAQSTVCGGGRYDDLIEQLWGKSVPGAGFGLGLERLLLILDSMERRISDRNFPELYVAPVGKDCLAFCLKLTQSLRQEGVKVETDHMERSLKAQLKYADKIRARFVAIVGSYEIEAGEATVRDMSRGGEQKVSFAKLKEYIKGTGLRRHIWRNF